MVFDKEKLDGIKIPEYSFYEEGKNLFPNQHFEGDNVTRIPACYATQEEIIGDASGVKLQKGAIKEIRYFNADPKIQEDTIKKLQSKYPDVKFVGSKKP